jgi:hypothetical protein
VWIRWLDWSEARAWRHWRTQGSGRASSDVSASLNREKGTRTDQYVRE